VVVAALASWHDRHDEARRAAEGTAVPAHARLEAYSVLTRLPPPHRRAAAQVATVLESWFPGNRTIVPSRELVVAIVNRCSRQGIEGGAVYDALVGLTAAEAGETLVTRDVRAVRTYRRFGIDVALLE